MKKQSKKQREQIVQRTYFDEAMLAYKRSIPFSEFSEYLHDIVVINHDSAWGYAEGCVDYKGWESDPIDEVLADTKKDAIEMVAEHLADGARPYVKTYRVLLEDPSCPDELIEHRKGYVTCKFPPGLYSLEKYLVPPEATP